MTDPDHMQPETRIVLLYSVVASLWIFFSDALLYLIFPSELDTSLPAFSIIKGFLFIIVTATLLNVRIRQEFEFRVEKERALETEIRKAKAYQEALENSEARFRKAVEQAPMPMAIFADDGEMLSISGRWSAITGYTRDQLKTLDSWIQLAHPGRYEEILKGIYALFDTREYQEEGEFDITCADGSQRVWVFNSTPLDPLPDGRRVIASIAFDITEHKELQHNLQLYANIFQHTEIGVALGYPDDEVLGLINPAFARMHGYTLEELIGQPIVNVFAPEDHANMRAGIQAAHETGHSVFEAMHIHKDGTRFPVLIDVTAVRDTEGKVIYRVANVLDITERKRIRDELYRTNQFLQTLIESSPMGVMVVDPEGKIQLWNSAAERISGWSADETIGRFPPYLRENEYPEHQRMSEYVAQGNTVTGLEVQRQRKDGRIIDVNISGAPLYDAQGEYIGVLAIITDITEQIQARHKIHELNHDLLLINRDLEDHVKERTEQLEQAIMNLEEVQRIRDGFISTVNHELRTPITSIMLSLSNLMAYYDRMTHESRLNKLRQIFRQTEILAEMVESLLTLAQMDAPARTHEYVDLNVYEIALQVSNDVQSLIQNKQQTLTLEHLEDEDYTLHAHPADIKHLWRNLIGNALKYTPEGGQIIARVGHVMVRDEGAPETSTDLRPFILPDEVQTGHFLVGQVEDTGYGIPHQEIGQLFERFYRGWAQASPIPGTGLGLPLVKEILERYGGGILVESAVGAGSCFTFYLPYPPPYPAD